MYNVYVTNKSVDVVYVRLKSQELSSINPQFHQESHTLVSKGDTDDSYVQAFLVRWGFRLIRPQGTLSFATSKCTMEGSGIEGTHIKYASLYAASELWVMDEEVDFLNFGCLFVEKDSFSVNLSSKMIFSLSQVNPEPVWIRSCKDDTLPENAVKACSILSDELLSDIQYFGRSKDGTPCGVSTYRSDEVCEWYEGGKTSHTAGDILQATGHQLYRVKSGDPVPPNAVIVGVSGTEGSLYLGRLGGKIPCSVSTEAGKIKQFFYPTRGETQLESSSGEILVLTNNIES